MIFINGSTASTSRNNLLYVSGQRHDSESTCTEHTVLSRSQIIFTGSGEIYVSVDY